MPITDADANPVTEAAIRGHIDAYDPATGNTLKRWKYRRYGPTHNDADFDPIRYLSAKSAHYFKRAFGEATPALALQALGARFDDLFTRAANAGISDYNGAEVIRQAFLRGLDSWAAANPDQIPAIPARALMNLAHNAASLPRLINLIHADRLSSERQSELFAMVVFADAYEYSDRREWVLRNNLDGVVAWLTVPDLPAIDPNSVLRQNLNTALAQAHGPWILRDLRFYLGSKTPAHVAGDDAASEPYLARVRQFLGEDHFAPVAPKLRREEQKELLLTLRDKIRLTDIPPMQFAAMNTEDLYWALYEILAEKISSARRIELLQNLSPDKRIFLLESCFNQAQFYWNVREGSYHWLTAMKASVFAAGPERDILDGCLSTWYSVDRLRTELRQGHFRKTTPLNAGNLKTTLEMEADGRVDPFINWFKTVAVPFMEGNKAEVLPDPATVDEAERKAVVKLLARMCRTLDKDIKWVKSARAQRVHFKSFLKIFGFRPKHTFESSTAAHGGALFRFVLAWQVLTSVKALVDDKSKQRVQDGLDRIMLALPTAGKLLSDFHYVETQLETIQSTLDTIGGAKVLANYPFLVFDQSQPGIFAQNAAYLNNLNIAMHANIHHIGIKDVVELAKVLKIPEFFVTSEVRKHWSTADLDRMWADGLLNCGYGGARNIVAVLGSMCHLAMRNGTIANFADLKDLGRSVLRGLMKEALFDNPLMIMGDDDLTLMPGFMHAKSLLAYYINHPESRRSGNIAFNAVAHVRDEVPYVKVNTLIQGRGTTTVPAGALLSETLGNAAGKDRFNDFVSNGVGASIAWKDVRITREAPGEYSFAVALMAGNLMHPASCADLPHPTEEKVMNGMATIVDQLAHTLHHPADRFDSIGRRNLNLAFYVQKIHFATNVTNYAGTDRVPWNAKTPNLGSTWRIIVTAPMQATYKRQVAAKFRAYPGHPRLEDRDTINGHFTNAAAGLQGAIALDPILGKELATLRAGFSELATEKEALLFFMGKVMEGADDGVVIDVPAMTRKIKAAVDAWKVKYEAADAAHRLNFRKSQLTYMAYLTAVSVFGGRFYKNLERMLNLADRAAAVVEIEPVDLDALPDVVMPYVEPVVELPAMVEPDLAPVVCDLCEVNHRPSASIRSCANCGERFGICGDCIEVYTERRDKQDDEGDLCKVHLPAA